MRMIIDLERIFPEIYRDLKSRGYHVVAFLSDDGRTYTKKVGSKSFIINITPPLEMIEKLKNHGFYFDGIEDFLFLNLLRHELYHIYFEYRTPEYYLGLLNMNIKDTELLWDIFNVIEDTRIESYINRREFVRLNGIFFLNILIYLKEGNLSYSDPIVFLKLLSGYRTEVKYLMMSTRNREFMDIAQSFTKIKFSSPENLARLGFYIYNRLISMKDLKDPFEDFIKQFLTDLSGIVLTPDGGEHPEEQYNGYNGADEGEGEDQEQGKQGDQGSGGSDGPVEGQEEPEENGEGGGSGGAGSGEDQGDGGAGSGAVKGEVSDARGSCPGGNSGGQEAGGSGVDIDGLIRGVIEMIKETVLPISAGNFNGYSPGPGLDIPPPEELGYILSVMEEYNPSKDISTLIKLLKNRGEVSSEEGDFNPGMAPYIYNSIFLGYPQLYFRSGRVYPDLDLVILVDQSGSTADEKEEIANFTARLLILADRYSRHAPFKIHTAVVGFGENTFLYKDFKTPLENVTLYPRAFGGTPLYSALDRLKELRYTRFTAVVVVSDGIFPENEYNYEVKEKYRFPIYLITTEHEHHEFFDGCIRLKDWGETYRGLLEIIRSVLR
ncbi:MAG: hypothetical protein ACP5GL_07440 [Infirmifilum sp.]